MPPEVIFPNEGRGPMEAVIGFNRDHQATQIGWILNPNAPIGVVVGKGNEIPDDMWDAIRILRDFLITLFAPDAFNIWVPQICEEGGESVFALLIPRYTEDAMLGPYDDPRAGVRWMFSPEQARYWELPDGSN